MPNTIVVVLDLPICHSEKMIEFRKSSFDEQLEFLEKAIKKNYKKLHKMGLYQSDYIFVWRENGLTHDEEHFLSIEQTVKLKDVMSQLTKNYPQLTIIAPLSSKRELGSDNLERFNKKINSIIEGYDAVAEFNSDNLGPYRRNHSKALALKQNPQSSSIARKTVYIFGKGECMARRDSVVPNFAKNILYRVGSHHSFSNFINPTITVEFSKEHDLEVFSKKAEKEPSSLIKFILEGDFKPDFDKQTPGVHLCKTKPPKLILGKEGSNKEVSLFYVNLFSEDSALIPVKAQTIKENLMQHVKDKIERGAVSLEDIDSISQDNMGHRLFLKSEYIELMNFASNKYIAALSVHHAELHSYKMNQLRSTLVELLKKVSSYGDSFLQGSKLLELFWTSIKSKDLELLKFLFVAYSPLFNVYASDLRVVSCVMQEDDLELFKLIYSLFPKQLTVNSRVNTNGDTLLHLAAQFKTISICRYLLNKKACASIKNHAGQTPLDISRMAKYNFTQSVIEEHAPTSNSSARMPRVRNKL